MALELAVVDAFTAEPFKGNPAAVAILASFPSDAGMQAVARENPVKDGVRRMTESRPSLVHAHGSKSTCAGMPTLGRDGLPP